MKTPSLYQKGFTLVELMIAIIIIGILTVGVMAALDPGERINQSRDSSVRQTATQVLAAANTSLANTGNFPGAIMQTTFNPAANQVSAILGSSVAAGNPITQLVAEGLLPQNFATSATGNLSRIAIMRGTDGTNGEAYLVVCYRPQSKQQRNAAGLYTYTGAWPTAAATQTNQPFPNPAGAACAAAGVAARNTCVYCIR